MKNKSDSAALFIIPAVVLGLLVWVLFSYFEARTYSRITGQQISTFEAMFVNCRVVGTKQNH